MPEKQDRYEVAVIGGGASGVLLAAHLGEKLQSVLIDPGDKPGQGLAYGTRHDCHLLNVPAGNMSAYPDRPDHLCDWLCERQGLLNTSQTFISRPLYGDYLHDVFKSTSTINIKDSVIDLEVEAKGLIMHLQSGRALYADKVILAPGNQYSDPFPSLQNQPYWSANPWSEHWLEEHNPSEPILLIGTGLTMVDIALLLDRREQKAPIYAISRRGHLPCRHNLAAEAPPVLEGDVLGLGLRELVAYLRNRARNYPHDWHAVLDSLRVFTQRLWQGLSPIDRGRFLEKVRHYWDIHRHRIPPESYHRIDQLIREGRLIVKAAHFRSAEFDSKTGLVEVSIQSRSKEDRLSVSQILNCTGPEQNYQRVSNPFIQRLLEKNLIACSSLGIGLDCDELGKIPQTPSLYIIGPACISRLWEITAIPDIRVQAQRLGAHLNEI